MKQFIIEQRLNKKKDGDKDSVYDNLDKKSPVKIPPAESKEFEIEIMMPKEVVLPAIDLVETPQKEHK